MKPFYAYTITNMFRNGLDLEKNAKDLELVPSDCDTLLGLIDDGMYIGAAVVFALHVYEDIYTAILEIAKHFEDGSTKYGERNWEKGIPCHSFLDSGIRHLLRFFRGDNDERHDRAFMWNMLCLAWTIKHHPEMNDLVSKRGSNDMRKILYLFIIKF